MIATGRETQPPRSKLLNSFYLCCFIKRCGWANPSSGIQKRWVAYELITKSSTIGSLCSVRQPFTHEVQVLRRHPESQTLQVLTVSTQHTHFIEHQTAAGDRREHETQKDEPGAQAITAAFTLATVSALDADLDDIFLMDSFDSTRVFLSPRWRSSQHKTSAEDDY